MTYALSLAVAALAASASALPNKPPTYPGPAKPSSTPAPGPTQYPVPKPPASYNIPGYTGVSCGSKAINAPNTPSCYTYIGEQTWNDGTYNPQRCIDACEATTSYNAEHLSGRATCRFVNTYVLLKNGLSQGQVCAMYTRSWDASYSTNVGYTDGSDKFTISMGWTYSNNADAGNSNSVSHGFAYRGRRFIADL